MSAPYSYASSDSELDSDDAPEAVSFSSSRQGRRDDERREREARDKLARAKKERNRAKARQQQDKGKGKAKAAEEDDEEDDEDAEYAEEDLEELAEEEDGDGDDTATAAPPQLGKKTTYLDDSLFAEAAAHYAPDERVAPGMGKKAMHRQVREEKRRKREEAARKRDELREGGAQQVGDITLQHLPSSSTGPASLSSTALPSHTSATKFLTSRLYSKKRQVAVLDAGRPSPSAATNPKKQKRKGGMSLESRILLGLEDEESADVAKEKERKRKKSLLLQAEGQRKAVTSARPLASARRGAKPAANFAVSTFRG